MLIYYLNIYYIENKKLSILSLQYHHVAISFTPKKSVGIYLPKVNNEYK